MAKFRIDNFKGPLMRGSYMHGLFKARAFTEGAQEKYSCTLILPKSDEAGLKLLQGAVARCVVGEWGDRGKDRFQKGLIRNPILAGDGPQARNKESGDVQPGLGPDFVFIRVQSNQQPVVVDKRRRPVTDPEDCPSGWWGYPVLNAFTWHHPQNGDGISFGIAAFQVTQEDEILGGGGRVDPDKFFDVIGGDDAEALAGAGSAADLFA